MLIPNPSRISCIFCLHIWYIVLFLSTSESCYNFLMFPSYAPLQVDWYLYRSYFLVSAFFCYCFCCRFCSTKTIKIIFKWIKIGIKIIKNKWLNHFFHLEPFAIFYNYIWKKLSWLTLRLAVVTTWIIAFENIECSSIVLPIIWELVQYSRPQNETRENCGIIRVRKCFSSVWVY